MTVEPGSGFAEINGTRLFYEVAGSGHPLTMVHAGVADRRLWDKQWPVFAERYTAIRYDMRGFGRSGIVDAEFSHQDDLRALLQFLGVERTHLMGCSRGGTTAIDLTLAHPKLVSALIVVGSSASGGPAPSEAPHQWEEIVSSYKAGDLERTSELEVQVWVDGPHRRPEQVDSSVRELVRAMNLIALRNEQNARGDERPPERAAFERLGEIRVPTLIVVGDQDQPHVIASADLMAERIPAARKVVMSGTAHVPSLEQPAEFNRIVLDFLSSL
jgi:3-oxoadipate enol-lactonase